ncbi:hypothetical protein LCGC14_3166320, partial [marine sediment metagenome]
MDDIKNTIICGNSLEVIPTWQAESVDCCVTSPPYWGLRDYGLPPTKWPDGSVCCYGLEPTPELYVEHTVLIFAEVWRVLKPEGTLWLNLGDSYNAYNHNRGPAAGANKNHHEIMPSAVRGLSAANLKPKDLVGIPWRVAFALQADGWYLRQDIIWNKPNPMPESVTDRCTKAHEYIFLLSKSARYYFDAEAIREAAEYGRREQPDDTWDRCGAECRRVAGGTKGSDPSAGRNKRSVWTVPTF